MPWWVPFYGLLLIIVWVPLEGLLRCWLEMKMVPWLDSKFPEQAAPESEKCSRPGS